MKKILLTAFFFLFSCLYSLQAQSWQWGKRGGGADALIYSQGPESVKSMATDALGNIFIISDVSKTGLNIDGVPKTSYANSGSSSNGALASFNCDGTYRWSKIIGGGSQSSIADIKTDSQGNVYIVGTFGNQGTGTPNHFDTDLVLPLCTNTPAWAYCQTFYIAKYSNTGSFLWVKFPEPDNITTANLGKGYPLKLVIDSNDNLHIFSVLYSGVFANGAYTNTLPNYTVHILKYNVLGNFISGIHPDITITNYSETQTLQFARNPVTGDYYFAGYYFVYPGALAPVVGGIAITHNMFLTAFNAQGSYLWKIENTTEYSGERPKITTDNEGNIYFASWAFGTGNEFGYTGDSFAGIIFPDNLDNLITVPFVVKLNSSGQAIWGSNASYGGQPMGGVVVNGNEVGLAVPMAKMRWGGQEIGYEGVGQSLDPALVRLNKNTGELIDMKKINSSATSENRVESIVADHLGNYYLGGKFSSQLFVGSTTLTNSGSESDFFVAKFGTNNCTCQVPTCMYKANNTATQPNTFDFKYIGQEVYTTVSWNFGDGSPTSNLVNPTHAYATTGIYNVCVTATNACDTYTFCKNLDTSILGTADFSLENPITLVLYPNPAQNQVNIQYESQAANAQLEIYDLTGRLIASHSTTEAKGTWQLPLHNMASGIYVVVLKENNQIIMQKKLQVL